MIRAVLVAGLCFLAACDAVKPGCGLGTHHGRLGSGIYTGPDEGLAADLRAGDPIVCRLTVRF